MSKVVHLMHCGCRVIITVISLNLLLALTVPDVLHAEAPGAICVLKIDGNGRILGTIVDKPENFKIAVVLPWRRTINIPIPCNSLGSVALGVANNEPRPSIFHTKIFTHDGVLFCDKGDFEVQVNGARGVTFSDCL
jgi:hypothetical protein